MKAALSKNSEAAQSNGRQAFIDCFEKDEFPGDKKYLDLS